MRGIRVDLDHATRDAVLRLVAVGGIIYETVAEHVDRPYLLATFLGMLGLPSFLRKDEKDHGEVGGSDRGKHRADGD